MFTVKVERTQSCEPSVIVGATVDVAVLIEAAEPVGYQTNDNVPELESTRNIQFLFGSAAPIREISVEFAAGVQSSNATCTRKSMSPVMSKEVASGTER